VAAVALSRAPRMARTHGTRSPLILRPPRTCPPQPLPSVALGRRLVVVGGGGVGGVGQ